jgi:hypothetical protein
MRALPFLCLGFFGILLPAIRATTGSPLLSSQQITAWGKPAQGLQAGIRCAKIHQVLKPGGEASFEIVVRNLTDKPIEFRYWPDGRYWGEAVKRKVVITVRHLSTGQEPRPYTTHIHPGKELVLGALTLGHVRLKTPNTAYAPRPELLPGKYKVGTEKLTDAVGVTLGTGYLDLELRKK